VRKCFSFCYLRTYSYGCALNFCSGATTSSARATSAGGKESQGEVDRVKDTEEEIVDSKISHSLSVGITNEDGGSVHLEQVSLV